MKRGDCETCGPRAYLDAAWQGAFETPVWRCRNCGTETPRQLRTSAKQRRLQALIDELLKR